MKQCKISDFFNVKNQKTKNLSKKKFKLKVGKQKNLSKFFGNDKTDDIDKRIEENKLYVNKSLAKRKITYLNEIKRNNPSREINYDVFEDKYVLNLISLFEVDIPDDVYYYIRMSQEFTLIMCKKFYKVFIQVKQILKLTQDIPHIIRGSAGSSVVCYLMGITNIDPVKNKIPLTRFMHIRRDSNPDIDIDFPAHLREFIYEIIFRKWENRVARISNHVLYKEKSALKQAIKNRGYNKFLPKNFNIFDIFKDEDVVREICKEADELIGKFRLHSLHCGGIVIFNKEVPKKYLLKEFNIYKDRDFIQGAQLNLNKDDVEDLNFIKIDILSNRGLSQLMGCSDLPLIEYPYDEKVYQLFINGDNLGLTYGESRGMRRIFMELKPNSIDDLAIALALIRPAASKNGQKFNFLKNFHMMGRVERDDYIIYDDDAIEYIARLLNISNSEADLYRKAFAKRKYKKKMEFRQQLAYYRRDLKSEKRGLIYDQLCCLEEYSFCKSHAYSYAYLLYGLAYNKVHNPKVFWKSTLEQCNTSYRNWVHYREAINVGINVKSFRKRPKNDISMDPVKEYFQRGYWESKKFMPGMYCEVIDIIELDEKTGKEIQKKKYLFKGLIATSKLYVPDRRIKKFEKDKKKKKSKFLTFITIGWDNGKYLDVVVWGKYAMSKIHCIEGTAIMEDEGWILANNFHFCFL